MPEMDLSLNVQVLYMFFPSSILLILRYNNCMPAIMCKF